MEDSHDATLVSNVHPPDWVNPEPAPRYNLVVLGAGTAGLVTAAGAAGLGARVALVEKGLMGGDCLNVGCVPSKSVLRSSRAIGEIRRAPDLGVRVPEGAEADFPAVMERMRSIRARISRHDSAERFRKLGVDVFFGEGRFRGRDTVSVGDRTLRFKKAVIATGARAAELPIDGLPEAGFLTNETVFSLTERPRRLAVVGSGPIGCELAQAFRRLGSEVVLLQDTPHILNREDEEAARIVENAFVREVLDHILTERHEVVILDLEAGYEHLGRGTARGVDVLLVVLGSSRQSLETAKRIRSLASELQIEEIWTVANGMDEGASEPGVLKSWQPKVTIPWSPALRQQAARGEPAQAVEPAVVAAVSTLREKLEKAISPEIRRGERAKGRKGD